MHAATNRCLVARICILTIQVGVVTKAIALMAVSTQPVANAVVCIESAPNRNAARKRTVATNRQLSPSLECFRGSRAAHVNEAGQGVCPVAASLRPAQNLDLLHIEQGRDRTDTAEIYVVDQEPD